MHDLGFQVGARILDLMFVRDRAAKRELKLLNALLMVKTTLWKTLFGKEADKLEHANDDERTYYIIEKEPLVNTFISVPKVELFESIQVIIIVKLYVDRVDTIINCHLPSFPPLHRKLLSAL